ncbi:MAG: CDP-alcohol phosphatidyltransferase family protein, partial [Pseudomonadota bacterium]|nr:CDP-alcohol phosphatidyltransferase family protein [Pseudomonadota bacterium]
HNTLFFLFISFIIFLAYIKYNERFLTYASVVTYCRAIINILIFSIIINIDQFNIVDTRNNYINILPVLFFISLILDGLDGYLARLLDQTSEFGTKFDLEIDTFLLLLLSFSLYKDFNANLAVFLIPLYRYLFFILQFKLKWLRTPLPESMRRKFICFFVTLLLIISHFSFFPMYLVNGFINLSILLITFSFLKDIIWLYRKEYS